MKQQYQGEMRTTKIICVKFLFDVARKKY